MLKDTIAELFKTAREEGATLKGADGKSDAGEALSFIRGEISLLIATHGKNKSSDYVSGYYNGFDDGVEQFRQAIFKELE